MWVSWPNVTFIEGDKVGGQYSTRSSGDQFMGDSASRLLFYQNVCLKNYAYYSGTKEHFVQLKTVTSQLQNGIFKIWNENEMIKIICASLSRLPTTTRRCFAAHTPGPVTCSSLRVQTRSGSTTLGARASVCCRPSRWEDTSHESLLLVCDPSPGTWAGLCWMWVCPMMADS